MHKRTASIQTDPVQKLLHVLEMFIRHRIEMESYLYMSIKSNQHSEECESSDHLLSDVRM